MWKKGFIWFLFLGSFGFAGGGSFLLFAVVPLEQWLVDQGLSQAAIDNVLKYFVYGWIAFGFIVSFIFYAFLLRKAERHRWAYSLTGITLVAATAVLYLFLNTETLAAAGMRGQVEDLGERFTFGPYPELEQMEQLKAEGYDGIITLVHPTVPFERVLLQKELENGEKVGIPVYSFPMLPWVSDNQDSIQSIQELASANDGKRYYVHCYLGKHRVDLIRQVVQEALGQEVAVELMPDQLERGELWSFPSEKVTLGPYPTDEEWFHTIQRRQVKEIISTLDPNNAEDRPWIEKEKAFAKDYGLIFTLMPLNAEAPDPMQVQKIVDYIENLDHKVYVHDFLFGKRLYSIDAGLRGKNRFSYQPTLPETFERGALFKVGNWAILGPYPTPNEAELLDQIGVKKVISLLDPQKIEEQPTIEEEKAWTQAKGFQLEQAGVQEQNLDMKKLRKLARSLQDGSGPYYIHGFTTDARVEALHQLLSGLTYGVGREIDGTALAKGQMKYIHKHLVVGPEPSHEEWRMKWVHHGFESILYLQTASSSESDVQRIEALAQAYEIDFDSIPWEDYEDRIRDRMIEHRTTYLMVPPDLIQSMSQEMREKIFKE